MKFSVVLAAYNEEKIIDKCIEALLGQDYPKSDYEIIVVDNNSTDKTSNIVKDKGLTPYLYKEKQGAVWAKNYAATLAKGEIIVITDADTVPDKNWLSMIDLVLHDKNIQIAGGRVRSLGRKAFPQMLFNVSDILAKVLNVFGVPLIWGSNMAIRKSAFEKVKGINTRLETGDDWDIVLRVQKKFGIKSAKYDSRISVKASPRKQNSISAFGPYVLIAVGNFISIFILRKSFAFGRHVVIR